MDPGSILWRAFFSPPFFPPLSLSPWHGFNPYQNPIFFPITPFLFFPSFFPSFAFSSSFSPAFLPFFFILFFPFLFFFFFLFPFSSPFCCFSFSLSSLSFIHLISSSFPPPLSFSLFFFVFLALKVLSFFTSLRGRLL